MKSILRTVVCVAALSSVSPAALLVGVSSFSTTSSVNLPGSAGNYIAPGFTGYFSADGQSAATGGSADGTWGPMALSPAAPSDNGFVAPQSYFTVSVEASPGTAPWQLEALVMDYRTTGSTNFLIVYSLFDPRGYQNIYNPIATVEEPSATVDYKPLVIGFEDHGLGNFDFAAGWRLVFSVVMTGGGMVELDNIGITTTGPSAITLVPEPGGIFGAACVLGAGAFFRVRKRR